MESKNFSGPRTRRPSKWLALVGIILLGYAFVQPGLRERGWPLPSVASLLGTTDVAEQPQGQNNALDSQPTNLGGQLVRDGVLRETAPEDYLSPAGLRYTPGSEQGHRLRHLQRHLVDDPGRPGKHGVFEGDLGQVIRWLDETYERARDDASGTSRREEGTRTIYEATFAAPVGFVGGREGKQHKNPAASKIRLVVEGDRVITAFPF